MSGKWAQLTDSEKGQLVSLWILAADRDGLIPSDPNILRKLAMLDEAPNINKFIDLGLLTSNGCQDGVNVTTNGRQNDAPEAEAKAEAKAEREKKPPRRTRLPADWQADQKLHDYLNEKRPDLDAETTFENFKDYYLSHGKLMADWNLTCMRWIREERKGNGKAQYGTDGRTVRETPVQRSERLEREALGI
jgi:hypothetical protein